MKDILYIVPCEQITEYFNPKYPHYLDDLELILPKLVNMLSINKYTAVESHNWLIGNDLSLHWSLLNQRNPGVITFDQFKESYLRLIPIISHCIGKQDFVETEITMMHNNFYIRCFMGYDLPLVDEFIDDYDDLENVLHHYNAQPQGIL